MISVERSGAVARVVLDRPPANAVNARFTEELRDAFLAVGADWDVKVVILESAVARFFCAGADKHLAQEPVRHQGTPTYPLQLGRESFEAVQNCPVPVIAKIGGIAVGGGFLYACLADFIVAGESAQFALMELRARVVGGAAIARRALSEQAVRYLMWSTRMLSAPDLLALGAGIHVVPDDQLDEEVDALAASIAAHDAQLVRFTKAALNEASALAPIPGYVAEQKYTALLATTGPPETGDA
jgi:enoyl-CoA hydratase